MLFDIRNKKRIPGEYFNLDFILFQWANGEKIISVTLPADIEMIRILEALETEHFFFRDASFTLVRFLT